MLCRSARGHTGKRHLVHNKFVVHVLEEIMAMPQTDQNARLSIHNDDQVIASYDDYTQAQRAVDYLSDSGFAVNHLRIVGHGVRTVEIVGGRMTKGRAALAGAASGAWLGLMFGLLLSLFAVGFWLAVVVAGLVFGAIWGAVLGFVGHAMTGGRRDFSSSQTLIAERYDVMADASHADEASRLLARM